jgi:hypothetical protein
MIAFDAFERFAYERRDVFREAASNNQRSMDA